MILGKEKKLRKTIAKKDEMTIYYLENVFIGNQSTVFGFLKIIQRCILLIENTCFIYLHTS